MTYPFKNLIFEGGGVKGIAYVGALQELSERDILRGIDRVGGASAGAINAVLTALGYSLDETRDILWDLDFKKFMDDSWGIVRDTQRLINKYGWYKGDFFRSWIGKLIKEKIKNEHATFNDLRNRNCKDLYIVGTNLTTGFSEVFSFEHTPRMRVIDAVRISMSIPLFFTAVKHMSNDTYVDGGVLNNYPIKLFDREKYIRESRIGRNARKTDYYAETNRKIEKTSSKYVYNKESLGFRLDSSREIAMFRDGAEPVHNRIDDFFDYAWALINTLLSVQDVKHLHSDDWHRTIYIDTLGVSTTDFNLSDELKKKLVDEGLKGIRRYFDWYDRAEPGNMPINHPDSDL